MGTALHRSRPCRRLLARSLAPSLAALAALAGRAESVPLRQEQGFATLARRLESALSEGDAEAVDAAFDREAFLGVVMEGIPFPGMIQAEYRAEYAPDLAMGTELCGERRAAFKLLGVDETEGRATASYRSWDGSRLDVLELAFARSQDGDPRLVDARWLRAGQTLSTKWRREYAEMYAADKAGLLKRLPEPEKSWVRCARQRESFELMRGRGELEQAAIVLDRLPPAIAQERATHYLRMDLAAERASPEAFLLALGTCRAAFPGDLGADLVALEYFETQGARNDFLFTLDRMGELLGPDGVLHCIRARRMLAQGQEKGAQRAFLRAVRDEPELPDGHWGLIEIALANESYKSLPKFLERLEKLCPVELGDLTDRPEFAGFVASRYYERWMKRRKK